MMEAVGLMPKLPAGKPDLTKSTLGNIRTSCHIQLHAYTTDALLRPTIQTNKCRPCD